MSEQECDRTHVKRRCLQHELSEWEERIADVNRRIDEADISADQICAQADVVIELQHLAGALQELKARKHEAILMPCAKFPVFMKVMQALVPLRDNSTGRLPDEIALSDIGLADLPERLFVPIVRQLCTAWDVCMGFRVRSRHTVGDDRNISDLDWQFSDAGMHTKPTIGEFRESDAPGWSIKPEGIHFSELAVGALREAMRYAPDDEPTNVEYDGNDRHGIWGYGVVRTVMPMFCIALASDQSVWPFVE